MAASVLGKRNRSVRDVGDVSIITRSKRRIPIFDDNAENEGPFCAHEVSPSTQVDECMQLDELAKPGQSKTKSAWTTTTSASFSKQGRRSPLSPTKGNSISPIKGSPQRKTANAQKEPPERIATQTPTPRTPRHRDALSKKAPITPKHRVSVVGKPLTPQSALTTASPTNAVYSIYNEARKLFTRGAKAGALIGREKERSELEEFLTERMAVSKGGCVYISGPPGTGKSALVTETCQTIDLPKILKKVNINCMSVRSTVDIYSTLAVGLGISDNTFEVDYLEEALQSAFLSRQKDAPLYLVTLDEIDHLLALDISVLYQILEWALHPLTRLLLVGIANALDLTDRCLPRLKSQNLSPKLLPFLPYTARAIASVLTARVRSLVRGHEHLSPDFTPVLHPTAIQLISKKIASQTGDLRKAFDIARRVIDLIEAETKQKLAREVADLDTQSPTKTPLGQNIHLCSPESNFATSPAKTSRTKSKHTRISAFTAETAPRATLVHVVRVSSATFGDGISQRLRALNLQQKAVLCSLCAFEEGARDIFYGSTKFDGPSTPSKRRAPTIRLIFDAYTCHCKRDNILHPLTISEFRDVVGGLESMTMITIADGKSGSFVMPVTPSKSGKRKGGFGVAIMGDERRIAGVVGLKELEAAIEGAGSGILKSILHSSTTG